MGRFVAKRRRGKMKTILALALAALAAAEPEADADPYYYGGYGLGYGHGLYGGYRTYGLGYGHYYGKREAEAEPKAVAPVVSYAHHAVAAPVVSTAVHAVHTPVVSSYAQVSPSASLSTVGIAPAAIPAVGGAYAGAGRYVANSAGTVHVAKREAEADPYYYGGYGLGYRTYGGYGGYGLGYGRGYFYG